ncbi:MAG: tetratricopeptide repeat protein [Bacteroidales bacterium]|nr:tetratricopeptide repeat protein [Bacteroidales bacterium]
MKLFFPFKRLLQKTFVLIFLLNLINCNSNDQFEKSTAKFVGKQTCIECHQQEYDLWLGSDHDRAMDTASSETVRGDFNNAEFVWGGFTHKLYTKNDSFYVHTLGPNGKAGDYKIIYTFGVRPLQQYIIPFEDGRLQCLQIAWDSDKNRWFHLSDSVAHGEFIQPDDWLYWTRNGQNMNGMCAECHTTDYKKNYDPVTHKFSTTWAEIDVSCEACHGPASNHLAWAATDSLKRPKNVNFGLVLQTSNISSKQYIDQCAYCHSRRSSLSEEGHSDSRAMNKLVPQLLSAPFYYADGQIFEEDYVYASFLQTKMYKNNVKCNDCHNAHSLKTKLSGNPLCYQCHDYKKYDSKSHHFHNGTGEMSLKSNNGFFDKGNGTQCVDCHMTGRYYMGVDFRRDHSFRIPRPDLTISIGTPNACTDCHTDKTPKWAADSIESWYGKKPDTHFGTILASGRKGDTSAIDDLMRLSLDTAYTPIIRMSALELLGNYRHPKSIQLFNQFLKDSADIIRYTAVKNYYNNDLYQFINILAPLLVDSVKAVRTQAAFMLTSLPIQNIPAKYHEVFNKVLQEYINAANYSSDFSASRYNLGLLYTNTGHLDKAEDQFIEALRIDNLFYPAKINLAMIYNKQNQNDKAAQLFMEVIDENPGYAEAHYSLGLLLGESKEYRKASIYLKKAAELMPERARVYYNLALVYQLNNEFSKAEKSFTRLLYLAPDNIDYLYATAFFYVQTKQFKKAEKYANLLLEKFPNQREGTEIMKLIKNEQ